MNIAVCVKRIPKTAEADIFIEKDGKDIKKEHLVFALNDWDGYAVREASILKEKYGGEVTAITVGPEESKEVLTRCLAMGADRALRIAEDDNYAQVGVSLAQMLGLPHAAIVNRIEIEGGKATVRRELEGGLEEVLEVKLPAVLTIQSGINEPKYVSLAAILEAEDKEMKEAGLEEMGVSSTEPLDMMIDEITFPPAGKTAEILKGNPEEVVVQLTEILKKKKG
jgi:electron transfer flavoprotein beta subunit